MSASSLKEVEAKKLLKKEKHPSLFSGRYRFSPYMACAHRCIYCDGRFEKYHVEGDFDSDIVARINTPHLLKRELPKLREPGPVCISSGVSDPYQPVEEKLRLTRSAAEILSEGDHPVVIHTKSSLMLRDLPLWRKVNERTSVTLMVSLTMLDESIRRWLEPGASTVNDRFNLMGECTAMGIRTGVLAMPFIPYLTDGSDELSRFLSRVKSSGARFAMPGLLTLKDGRQKGFFFSALRKARPEMVDPLMKLYSGNDPWGNPPRAYSDEFYGRIMEVWSREGMYDLVPHEMYRGLFTLYDEFTILLGDMITLYRRKGTGVKRLRSAAERFRNWVSDKRRYCGRRRNLSYKIIDDYLRVMIHSGELTDLLGNGKLADFLAEVESGALLNYRTLELERKAEDS